MTVDRDKIVSATLWCKGIATFTVERFGEERPYCIEIEDDKRNAEKICYPDIESAYFEGVTTEISDLDDEPWTWITFDEPVKCVIKKPDDGKKPALVCKK